MNGIVCMPKDHGDIVFLPAVAHVTNRLWWKILIVEEYDVGPLLTII